MAPTSKVDEKVSHFNQRASLDHEQTIFIVGNKEVLKLMMFSIVLEKRMREKEEREGEREREREPERPK